MKYPTKKRMIPLILALAMCVSFLTFSVHAADSPAVSSNIDDHYYVNAQRYNDTIKSTLTAEGDGFTRVECIDNTLVIEYYDDNMQFLSGTELALELPVYGGVYLCEDYNFLMVGQNNTEESDETEVFRIIRYSKDWVRQDSASIYGANTVYPFDAGCVRFDRSGDILYIRTSHEMYTSDDGLNHQANVMIALRISDMTVTDQFTGVMNVTYGYVSHSFNQFVRVDGDTLLAVDHGDYYPRSVVLIKYSAPAGQETFYGRGSYVNALPIVESTGHYNDTGVSVGGFECSTTDYLIAGSSYDQTVSTDLRYAHRNIFVTATPKDDFTDDATTVHWLTNYTADDAVEVSPPHLVKLEDDRFFLVWTEDDVLKYCFLDGKGELEGEITTGSGALSDCVPTLDGDRVVWYVTNNSAPVFYEISTVIPHTHDYTCTTTAATCTEDGTAVYTCECGDSYSETLPATGHQFTDGACTNCGTPGGTCSSLNWILEAGTLTISGSGAMENFTYKSQMPWYACLDQVTAVVIEDGVTAIGDYAFYGMPNLETISIPESVTCIGAYAFKNCTALDGVILPAGLTKLGESAFYGCSSLTAIEIPASLWTVQPYTFKNCTSLASVTFHEGNLQKISDAAFYNTALTEVTLPDCLDILDVYVFKNCASLASVTLGSGIPQIREASFYGTAISEISIPAGITVIKPYAFKNCTSLAALDLPASLTVIDEASFYNCRSLETFVLPSAVVTIGDYAFRNCTSLTAIERDGGDPMLESVGTSSFQGCTSLLSFATNQGFTTIGDYAFKNCTSLCMVTMYGTEETLGDSAFYGCTGLDSIVICEGTKSIGEYCFAGSGLTQITFICNAPAIGANAFARVTAEAHYSSVTNAGWTTDVLQNYGGTLTWVDDEA